MSRQNDLKKLIVEHNRRLQSLKQKKAQLGYSADPGVELEIEDIEDKIKNLQNELDRGSNDEPPIVEKLESKEMSRGFRGIHLGEFKFLGCIISNLSVSLGVLLFSVIAAASLAFNQPQVYFAIFGTPTPFPTPTPTPTFIFTPAPTDTPMPTEILSPTPIWTSTSMPILLPNLEWILIPGGDFIMGSSMADIQTAVADCNAYEINCQSDWFKTEEPQRVETLDNFEITRLEITNAQYNLCIESGPCSPPRKISSDNSMIYNSSFFLDDYPVVAVTSTDAQTFCQWIEGRLPSEREWEKAARGTDGRHYPWGNTLNLSLANLYSSGPTRVGSYPSGASPYEVMDMAGNVAEFTSENVVRGGSWKTYPHHGRTTSRSTGSWLTGDFVNFDIGFRCVR